MERRGHTRYPVHIPMSFSGEGVSGEGTVIDLSKGGWKATVASTAEVHIGMYLILHLSMPDQASPIKVDVAAVRWTKGGEFGVEFLFMGLVEEERFDQFLKTLELGQSH